MPSHLLDISVYSQRLKPRPLPTVIARWTAHGDASLAISSICEAELCFGLARKNSERLWQEYRDFLENRLILLPVDQRVASLFGTLKASRQREGHPLADFDLLIAATALVHRLRLATLNARHFATIPELIVEDWS